MDKRSAPSRSMISSAVASTKSRVILLSRCASASRTARPAAGRVIQQHLLSCGGAKNGLFS